MFNRFLASIRNGNGVSSPGALEMGPANPGLPPRVIEKEPQFQPLPAQAASFDQIYQTAAVKLPSIQYGIAKLLAMTESPHLAGLTPEVKRCALLMALDAAGAQIEDVLQDAVARQRALNEFEEKHQSQLSDFETRKAEQNREIQAELDEITSQYMARIQANIDQVAQQQDRFQAWQRRKHQECQRMADAAAFLVPAASAGPNPLTAVLERASVSRR